jgi:hypothetical protein
MEIISKDDLVKLKSREISDCVGLPTLCPEERLKRRMIYRNFGTFYNRKCDATGKPIISMYHQDQPFPVYENSYWWSDNWSAKDFSRDFDFSKSALEQFHKLTSEVPRYNLMNINSENCEYINFGTNSQNCYLVLGCVRSEDCMYGHIVWDSESCVNGLYLHHCQWCSECVDCTRCYDTHFSTECFDCTESYFLHDCRSCKNCFACTNLRQKQYCFMNKQLTKVEYEAKIREIFPITTKTIEMGKTWLEKNKKETCVFPPMFGINNEDCTGNHLFKSKNCLVSFDAEKCEDSKFLYTSYAQENSYDLAFTGVYTKACYECLTPFNVEEAMFSHLLVDCNNVLYSEFCYNCHDIMLCSGLRNSQYCILNKQYSKEEYFKTREKIISHMKTPHPNPLLGGEGAKVEWGEFFPMELSPFAYNETVANEYFPLTKEEILAKNWKYREEKQSFKYDGPKYEIPAKIDDVDDEILSKILTCEATGKYYKIQKAELRFYRKMNLPIPRLCPDERHKRRMALRNPRKLFSRECASCQTEIQTTFAENRPEKVLCEKCYLQQVN